MHSIHSMEENTIYDIVYVIYTLQYTLYFPQKLSPTTSEQFDACLVFIIKTVCGFVGASCLLRKR